MAKLPTGVTIVTAERPRRARRSDCQRGLLALGRADADARLPRPRLPHPARRPGRRPLRGQRPAQGPGADRPLLRDQGAGGREVGRVAWTERDGVPAIDDALVRLTCRLRDVLAAGDHVIVTGEVTALRTSEGDPLVFHGGEFRPLELTDEPGDIQPASETVEPEERACDNRAMSRADPLPGAGLVHQARLQPAGRLAQQARAERRRLAGARSPGPQERRVAPDAGQPARVRGRPLPGGAARQHPVGAQHAGQRRRPAGRPQDRGVHRDRGPRRPTALPCSAPTWRSGSGRSAPSSTASAPTPPTRSSSASPPTTPPSRSSSRLAESCVCRSMTRGERSRVVARGRWWSRRAGRGRR